LDNLSATHRISPKTIRFYSAAAPPTISEISCVIAA